jgi:hypothetical protein
MSATIITILAVLYAVLLWAALFYVWYRGYKEWTRNRANRVHSVEARILDKRQSTSPAERPGEEGIPQFYILFEFRGRQREYAVEEAVFREARVGREGTLYLKGDGYEKFEPRSEIRQAEDVFRKMTGK